MMFDLVSRLTGIVTSLNTPFTADNQVDVESLRRNIDSALDAGVAGFLVPALAAEVGKLSEAERSLLVKTTVETVNGRAVVIGGATSATEEERVRNGQKLIDLGCDGILAAIPYTNDDAYTRSVEALDALKPGFLMLQDWEFQGYGLPLPLIVRLFETVETFKSIKIEVAPAGVKYSAVLEATGGRIHVAGGWAVTQMIEALDRGVHTFMPTGMHGVYCDIDRLYRNGDRAGAQKLFYRLIPVLGFSNQHLDISVHFFKRLMHRQEIFSTANVRDPILPFDAVHERVADELIAYAIDLMEQIDRERA